MSQRGRQRILLAADMTPTDGEREAAIVGGIAQALLSRGSWDTRTAVLASQRTQMILSDIDDEGDAQPLVYPYPGGLPVRCDRGPVTTVEMRRAIERFMQVYKTVEVGP